MAVDDDIRLMGDEEVADPAPDSGGAAAAVGDPNLVALEFQDESVGIEVRGIEAVHVAVNRLYGSHSPQVLYHASVLDVTGVDD